MPQSTKSDYAGKQNRQPDLIDKNRTLGGPDEKKAVPAEQAGTVKPAPSVQPVSERFPALEKQEIKLTFFAPQARMVQVAGTFNGWRPEADPMEPTGSGEWVARLMLKAGQYEYRFVVDGVWTDDTGSPEGALNPYGERNSVLRVELDDRTDLL
jgi:hypothetical protein